MYATGGKPSEFLPLKKRINSIFRFSYNEKGSSALDSLLVFKLLIKVHIPDKEIKTRLKSFVSHGLENPSLKTEH